MNPELIAQTLDLLFGFLKALVLGFKLLVEWLMYSLISWDPESFRACMAVVMQFHVCKPTYTDPEADDSPEPISLRQSISFPPV